MIILDHEQNTPEWHEARLGIPTASCASMLITSQGKRSTQATKYARKLAGDMLAGEDTDAWQGNKYTDRGHEIEAEARAWYAFERDVELRTVGLALSDDKRYGASFDSLSPNSSPLEIKCLPRQHIDALLYYRKHGKQPSDYVQQCQMQLLVAAADWLDLLYYHPAYGIPNLVIRVNRDDQLQDKLIEAIDTCISERDSIISQLSSI